MLSWAASRASCHGPPSTRTSTFAMPRSCAQATPATGTCVPAFTCANDLGTSIREDVLIGARTEYPRVDQYALKSANRVTSRSTSHLVADT